MTEKTNSKPRFVRCPKCLNVLPEPKDVPVYKCGGCGATLQAKRRNNSAIGTTPQRPDDDSSGKQKAGPVLGDGSDQNSDHDHDAANKSKNEECSPGKQKMKQLCDDHEASSSSNQQSLADNHIHNDPRSSTELSGHDDPESSPEATGHPRTDQDQEQNQNRDQQNVTVEATSIGLEHSSCKQKINQLSDDKEACSSSNQQLKVNSINEPDQSSDHNRSDQDYNEDNDQVFLSCRHEVEFEESSSEFEEPFANSRIVRDSGGGSKSSFKSLIAEKLLDTRRKKAHLDEDDVLPEDGIAELHHRRRFDRITSVETTETARFGGTSNYEGSVSSFDGNDDPNPRKYRTGSIGDEHVGSGNGYRRNQIHHLNCRSGKVEHRFHKNPKSHMIPENPQLERLELLKMVRDLQEQLDRTNISNPQRSPLYNTPGRYGQRMAFSGETTAVNRRVDGSSCQHCCPPARHFSAQLPHQHVCCNGPHYEPNTYYSPRISGLSSPIHNHSEPEFFAPDDDYIHRNNAITNPIRSPKKKRYVRPIANGSPWVTCYRCSSVLELPLSFIVFNKRYNSLRCGACFKVLDFTLSDGTHISRYYPEETTAAPPCSEVEDYDERNGLRAGPVSCSDRSFQRDYSTETDRIGSWEFSEERRKATMSRDPSGSAQTSSSKVSGRRNVGPRPNGSPLHELMGYASPSKVIRG